MPRAATMWKTPCPHCSQETIFTTCSGRGIPAHYCFLCGKPYLFWDVYFQAERALKKEVVIINIGSRFDRDTLQNPKYYKYDWIEQQEDLDMRRWMDGN